MLRATDLAHVLIRPALASGAWAVDATVGNGFDTQFLAETVGSTGRVFGFDIQPEALVRAAERVADQPQVSLFHRGHERMEDTLPPEAKGRLAAVMFNLGYLPGAPKETITLPETTLPALSQALGMLARGGIISLLLYPGHPGGGDEASAVRAWLDGLPDTFAISQFRRLNSRQPAPELWLIERQR